MSRSKDQSSAMHPEYVAKFKGSFLLPKYWLSWFGVLLLWFVTFTPIAFRNKLASIIVKLTVKPTSKSYKVVKANLSLCFSDKTESELSEMIARFFYLKARIFLDYAFFWFASEKRLKSIYQIYNEDELIELKSKDKNIILLTGHMLALDYGAQALSFEHNILGLVKAVKNPVIDWLVVRGRTRFKTRLYGRSFGMKGIIKSIKSGDQFFYLPDEDLSNADSAFVPFFNVQKASITALGRMAKICDAKIIPCASVFNEKTGKYEVHFLPSLSDYPSGDKMADTLRMNQVLEELVLMAPEQYLWTFRYFKNRPAGESAVYE